MKRLDLAQLVPLSVDPLRECRWLIAGGAAAVAFSLVFLIRYIDAYSDLFLPAETGNALLSGVLMPYFVDLLGYALKGFLVLLWGMPVLMGYHFISHYQGGKSIYTMLRLPSRWELVRRCFAMPVLATVGYIAAALAVTMLYFWLYMAATPAECIQPGQWAELCSSLLS